MADPAKVREDLKAKAKARRLRVQASAGAPIPESAPEMPWSDVGQAAIENLWPSAKQYGKDTITPFMEPKKTLQSLADLGNGIIQQLIPGEHPDEKIAKAVGEFFVKRYGGVEEIKRTLATDPVGALGDLSLVLSGGGTMLTRAPSLAGKVGSVIQKTGATIDPLSLAGSAAKAAGAGKLATSVFGGATGTSADAVRQAYQSGVRGGPQGQAFRANLREQVPTAQMVAEARKGLEGLKAARRAEYLKSMKGAKASTEILDFQKIKDALHDVADRGRFKGEDIRPRATKAWDEIADVIENWRELDPSEFHTVEGFDALKQKIWNIYDDIPYDQKAAKDVAGEVYHAIRDVITEASPDYAKAMKGYEEASDLIDEIQRTMSMPGGKKANLSTTVGKLQTIMRNNATTHWGRRRELGGALEGAGARTLMPGLAGQAMQPIWPRGLAGNALITGILGGSYMQNPLLLALMPGTSPRAVGEVAHGLGRIGPTKARAAARAAFQSGRLTNQRR